MSFFSSARRVRMIIYYSLPEIRKCPVTWKREGTCRDKGFDYLKQALFLENRVHRDPIITSAIIITNIYIARTECQLPSTPFRVRTHWMITRGSRHLVIPILHLRKVRSLCWQVVHLGLIPSRSDFPAVFPPATLPQTFFMGMCLLPL